MLNRYQLRACRDGGHDWANGHVGRCCSAVSRMAGCPHAWNQPHPRRGADPRRTPRRRVVHRRPRPHRLRQGVREHHRAPVHLQRARRQHVRRPGRAPPSTRSCSTASRSTAFDVYARQPDRARRPARPTTSSRVLRTALQPHRRGPAPLRRPGRRQGLPLHPVRGPGRPPRVHHVRAARPQVDVHLQRDRALALGGRLQRPDPGAERVRRRRRRCGASRPPSGCRPTSPRWSPASTTACSTPTRASTARSRSATTAASRWSSTSTATSSSSSPSRASSSSRRPSTSPTRSRSTTSSTCRSTTWARWRTPAA